MKKVGFSRKIHWVGSNGIADMLTVEELLILMKYKLKGGKISINPLGQFLGAIIMFGVLGMLPGYIIAKVLNGMGKLRIPREVELAGLDYEMMESAKSDEKAVSSATR